MQRQLSILFTCLFLFQLNGCGQPDLTRDVAAEIIAASPNMQEFRSQVFLQPDAREKGELLGWWQLNQGWPQNTTLLLQNEVEEFGQNNNGTNYFKIKQLTPISVTITGIAGKKENPSRVVEFEWKYDKLPPLVRRLATNGGTGVALFREYDDGWRLVEIGKVVPSQEMYPLTTSEQADYSRDLALENNKRLAARNAVIEAAKAFEARISQSMMQNKIISKHSFEASRSYGCNLMVSVTVTDVGLVLSETPISKGCDNHYRYKYDGQLRPFASSSRHLSVAESRESIGFSKQMFLLGMYYTFESDVKGLPEVVAMIDSANRSLNSWKNTFSDVVSGCERGATWGCQDRSIYR